MKKKLLLALITLSVITLLALILFSYNNTAYIFNSMKGSSVTIISLENLPTINPSKSQKLKYNVCSSFPVKILSEKPQENVPGLDNTMCMVSYNGSKLMLHNKENSMQAIVNVFKKTNLKNSYGMKSNRELLEMIIEFPRPEKRMFFYLQKHFEEAQIYRLGSFERLKSKMRHKYRNEQYTLYFWKMNSTQVPEAVEIITDNFNIFCSGTDCLRYLKTIKLI